jgi:hypothetical protein
MTTHATPAAPGMTCDILATHLLVQRALELAGKRLLNRTLRGTYRGDLRALHTHVRVNAEQLPRLLAGALDWADEAADWVGLDPTSFRAELTSYVARLLTTGRPHTAAALPAVLARVHRR